MTATVWNALKKAVSEWGSKARKRSKNEVRANIKKYIKEEMEAFEEIGRSMLVIWDVHWKTSWKDLVKNQSWDKVIFLWDYVDSFFVDDKQMVSNLKEIIKFKRDNPENVILLLWNHDIQYIWDWNRCSWRRQQIAPILKIIFEDNIELFKICHQEEGINWKTYLFSHAGFTEWWEERIHNEIDKNAFTWEGYDSYNKLLHSRWRQLLFICWISRWGKNRYGWPLWADKNDTLEGWKIEGYIQIVWHTMVPKIIDAGHIIYCDNLEYWDGIPLILNIK